jgi:class 3 adenylate cyclase
LLPNCKGRATAEVDLRRMAMQALLPVNATSDRQLIDRRGARQPAELVADAGRFLTTVLMTDIVDSTLTVAQHGDRRWREMLADHYADCRALTEMAGGELVSTTGDGVIAIFDGPTRAVRAAIAIEAAARASGIAVRAGVHTGECERMSEGLAGLAVHITARICALAGADEVMTTGIVRDLVLGSMLDFEPRGEHELRGVPGDWTVFRATDPG